MKAITYKNTKTNLPGWREELHKTQKFGYAYETSSHFVHFYGKDRLYIISQGLTVLEEKKGTLNDWVTNVFGAQDIEDMVNEVGHTVDGIWRPCLHYKNDVYAGLGVTKYEQRSAEQALRILVSKLDDLLEYIEPNGPGLTAYSHRTRELLILACTEVENQWKALLKKSGVTPANGRTFTTQDYVKLHSKSFLAEYCIEMRNYNSVARMQPFATWTVAQPTKSLQWYDAYNRTKHDRDTEFSAATLQVVLEAIAANIALFCTRFSPIDLLNESKSLSSIVNQLFEISLNNSDRKSFYLPELSLPANTRKERLVYDSLREGHGKPWIVDPLTL